MSGSPTEEGAKWLFERLVEGGLAEEVPRENLLLLCEHAMNFFFKDNVLQTDGLFAWFSGEYGVPEEKLRRVFSRLKAQAVSCGWEVEIKEPDAPEEPCAGMDRRKEVKEEDETEEAMVFPEAEEETPSQRKDSPPAAVSSVGPSRPRRPWQILPPKPRDPRGALSAFFLDQKYLEFAYLDFVLEGDCRKDARITALLAELFRPTAEEKEFLRHPDLEPGTAAETLEAWTVRLNGVALACALARDMARSEPGLDPTEWLRAVRQLNTLMGEITKQVVAKYPEAKAAAGPALASFEKAWSRMRQEHEKLRRESKRMTEQTLSPAGKTAQPAKASMPRPSLKAAAPPAEKETPLEGGGPRAFIQRNQRVVVLSAIVLLAGGIFYAIYTSGILKPTGIQNVSLDLSAAGFTPKRIFSDGRGVIVVVPESQWQGLAAEEKEERLHLVWNAARTAGYEQVQLWSPANEPLGMALSEEVVKVFR